MERRKETMLKKEGLKEGETNSVKRRKKRRIEGRGDQFC